MCNLSVERFLSSARLVGEYDGEAVEICCFSMGFCASFDRLARMFKKFVHNEGDDTPIIEEELTCPKCGTRYPEPDRKICPKCMDKVSISKRLLSHFGHYKKQMIIIIMLMLLTTGFNILSPYVGTKLLFDDVLTEGGSLFGMVAFVVAAIFLVRLGSLLLGILYSHTLAGIIPWVIYDIKLKIFTAMQKCCGQAFL